MTTVRARRHEPAPIAAGSEDGFTAGLESLAFGVLVFVIGTLIIANAWAVIDGRFATSAAAREAVRAVVQAEPVGLSAEALEARARTAAGQAFAAHGYGAQPLLEELVLTQARCATVSVTVALQVDPTLLPGIAQPLAYTVRSTHAEVVDPFRSGLEGDGVADCAF